MKIGRTTDVERRIANLRTGTNDLLIVHALEPGDPETERRRHLQFRDERHGEWCACSPALTRHMISTWGRNNILSPLHQQEIVRLHERIGIYRPIRDVFRGAPDTMNPSLNEPWRGRVFVDCLYALRGRGGRASVASTRAKRAPLQ